MTGHVRTGREGEDLAVNWLHGKGFTLVERNWRYGRLEIDIIATKADTLHIIEVKTRRTRRYGYPEEAVSRKKLKHLIEAADEYLHLHPVWKKLRFDILAITLQAGREPEYLWIEDVYL